MIDTGFADTNVVRLTLRRIRVRTAVAQVRASIEALSHLLDEQREPLARDRAALLEKGIGLTCGNEESSVGGGAIDGREGHALREHELLEGVKLFAQLLDRIEVGVRHGLFSCASGEDAIEPAAPAHRLCGGAE